MASAERTSNSGYAPSLSRRATTRSPASSIPILLTAVSEGRLTLERLVELTHHAPRRIFGLPAQYDTRVKVEPNARFVLGAENLHTKCGWTPFEGMPVRGKVRQVVLRGKTAYEDGTITAKPGYGKVIMPLNRSP